MKENWLNEKLCSFDEKVRIELGPQIIEMNCTEANLSDDVTAPHYKVGGIDALGKVISLVNTRMSVVDWKCKHVPKLWKVYQSQEIGKDKEGKPVMRFIKVDEKESKDDALDFARTLVGEM